MKIGINTYGLGIYLHKDEEGTWSGLQAAGITSVEPNIAFSDESRLPAEIQKAMRMYGMLDGVFELAVAGERITKLRNRGFEVYSIHISNIPFEQTAMEPVVNFMKENDITYGVYSFMESSVESIRAKENEIRKVIAYFHENGKEILIHNHDQEWKYDYGSCVMEYLLENIPEIKMELDLGWVEYAGRSSVEIMEKYSDKIAVLHIKEIKKGVAAHTKDPICVAPGEGILPLAEIAKAAKKLPIDPETAWIIDQDDAISGDIVGDVAKGIVNLKSVLDM